MIQKIYFNFSCNISQYKSLYNLICYANINECESGTYGNNDTKQCELCDIGFYADINHINCL